MYPIGPMRINPVQEFEHYFDVWLDGGRDGRLLRVSRDATCNDSPFRLAEALWRFGNPNGAAFSQLKRILATGIGEVVLDWSSEKDEAGAAIHSLWAYLDGEQWDTMIRAAWHSEPKKEKECSSPDGSASPASAETSDSASASASS